MQNKSLNLFNPKNWFKKSYHHNSYNSPSYVQFANEVQKKNNFRNLSQLDFLDRVRKIHTENSVVASGYGIKLNRINSFELRTFIKKDNKEEYYEDKIISQLLNRPNNILQKTIQQFNNILFQQRWSFGESYILYDKLYNQLSVVNQDFNRVLVTNGYNTRTLEYMPIEICINIFNIEKKNDNFLQRFKYDFDLNCYTSQENENLFLLRIVDNRYSDVLMRNTSLLSSLFEKILIYENLLSSQTSLSTISSNAKIILTAMDDMIGNEKMQSFKKQFNDSLMGSTRHGTVAIMPVPSKDGKMSFEAIDINTTAKDMNLVDTIEKVSKDIFLGLGIPEQLISGQNSHYDSRESSNIEFSENIANEMQDVYSDIAYFLNTILGNKDLVYIEVNRLSSTALYEKELGRIKNFEKFYTINEVREKLKEEKLQQKEADEILLTGFNTPMSQLNNSFTQQDDDYEDIGFDDEEKSLFSTKGQLEEAINNFEKSNFKI